FGGGNPLVRSCWLICQCCSSALPTSKSSSASLRNSSNHVPNPSRQHRQTLLMLPQRHSMIRKFLFSCLFASNTPILASLIRSEIPSISSIVLRQASKLVLNSMAMESEGRNPDSQEWDAVR